MGDDLERPLVDYVDRIAGAVRNVDAWRHVSNGRAESAGVVVGVDVDGKRRRPACPRVPCSDGGWSYRGQPRQLRDGRLAAPAGDDEPAADRRRGCVRDPLRKPSGKPDPTALRV